MLVVVTNYAIVDEESAHSWCWFFYKFRHFVAQDSVISERHQGIIHAMTNLLEWKEPLVYHRFCLQHIRSNLMKRYKNLSLKTFCRAIGSTTQKMKFVNQMRGKKSNLKLGSI